MTSDRLYNQLNKLTRLYELRKKINENICGMNPVRRIPSIISVTIRLSYEHRKKIIKTYKNYIINELTN